MRNILNNLLVRLVQLILLPTSLLFKLGVVIYQYIRNQVVASNPEYYNPYFVGVGALKISRKYSDKMQLEHRRKYYVIKLGKGFLVLNRENIQAMKANGLIKQDLTWNDIDKIAVYISQQKWNHA